MINQDIYLPSISYLIIIPLLSIIIIVIFTWFFKLNPNTLALNILIKMGIIITVEFCTFAYFITEFQQDAVLVTILLIMSTILFGILMNSFIKQFFKREREIKRLANNGLNAAINILNIATKTEASINEINVSSEEIVNTTSIVTRKSVSAANTSKEIEKIISLITTIGNQTNLLALNASIEAGRGGEYSSGLIVVSNEIRALADKTNKNTRLITEKVKEIIKNIEKTWKELEEINLAIKQQTTSMQEIKTTSKQLSLLSDDLKNQLSLKIQF